LEGGQNFSEQLLATYTLYEILPKKENAKTLYFFYELFKINQMPMFIIFDM
jgi:hypothetical protein